MIYKENGKFWVRRCDCQELWRCSNLYSFQFIRSRNRISSMALLEEPASGVLPMDLLEFCCLPVGTHNRIRFSFTAWSHENNSACRNQCGKNIHSPSEDSSDCSIYQFWWILNLQSLWMSVIEKEGKIEIFQPLVQSPGGHRPWGWARLKPGVPSQPPTWWQGQNAWAILWCFSQAICRELIQKWDSQDSKQFPSGIPASRVVPAIATVLAPRVRKS